jgi:hypothetical protein
MWVRNLTNYVAATFKTIMSYAELTFNAHGRGKKKTNIWDSECTFMFNSYLGFMMVCYKSVFKITYFLLSRKVASTET